MNESADIKKQSNNICKPEDSKKYFGDQNMTSRRTNWSFFQLHLNALPATTTSLITILSLLEKKTLTKKPRFISSPILILITLLTQDDNQVFFSIGSLIFR